MSHLVLARKYRPKSFSEVVGQDPIVNTLRSSIEAGRVAHALLFTGERGTGKTTIARLVAKALVCLNPKNASCCGACAQCIDIDNFSSLDIVEIDGASHTGVDDIRELRESARYQPTSAKYKIFIIDEVHMLSTSAFNALLKILEEPPPHVIFIFATTEVHKIPKTILSRVQRYDFRRVSKATIFQTLKEIMARENISIEDDGLRIIADLADGSLRDALSMLEQVLAKSSAHYTGEMVATTLGIVGNSAVKALCKALIEGKVDEALMIVKEIYEQGLDLSQLMDAVAERFRTLALCAHVDAKLVKTIVPSLDEDDASFSASYDKADLKRLFSMAIDGMSQVFSAQKPLLAVELFVLRLALRPPMSDALTINYCLQKLDAIMHHRPLPKDPLPFVNATKDFGALVAYLDKTLPKLASHLRHARPVFGAHELTLYFDQALHYEQCNLLRGNNAFTDAIEQVFGQKLKLTLELKKSPATAKAVKTVWEENVEKQKQEDKALHDRALANPLVKKALEIFGGDVVSIKKVTQ